MRVSVVHASLQSFQYMYIFSIRFLILMHGATTGFISLLAVSSQQKRQPFVLLWNLNKIPKAWGWGGYWILQSPMLTVIAQWHSHWNTNRGYRTLTLKINVPKNTKSSRASSMTSSNKIFFLKKAIVWNVHVQTWAF